MRLIGVLVLILLVAGLCYGVYASRSGSNPLTPRLRAAARELRGGGSDDVAEPAPQPAVDVTPGTSVMTPEKVEQACRMSAEGLTKAEIARRMGVSRSTISRHVAKAKRSAKGRSRRTPTKTA